MRGSAGRTDAGGAVAGRGRGRRPVAILLLAVVAAVIVTVAAAWRGGAVAAPGGGKIVAVGAESQYANVIGQVGGKYVQASAIMSNPNTDPHTFEASIAVAREVGSAQLVVQNGIGYDAFMNDDRVRGPEQRPHGHQRAAAPEAPGLHAQPAPVVRPGHDAARGRLGRRRPVGHPAVPQGLLRGQRGVVQGQPRPADRGDRELHAAYPGAAVATTEPVADYLLTALGAGNLTPWTFQADVMNGVDPSPQNVAAQRALLLRAQGEGAHLQPAGDRHPDRVVHYPG